MSSNSKMMEKIAGLLAHAEGAGTPEEAATYTEHAQKLATMYAVDIELARYRAAHKDDREEPVTRRVNVGEPGRQHKNRFWVDLALAITSNNDIRCTIAHDNASIWAYGFPSDIDVMEKLFVSLNVQMVQQCNENLRAGVHKELGVHGRTYRPNFYEGFVREMSWRLMNARAQALDEQKERDANAARLVAAAAPPKELTEETAVAEPVMTGALVMVKKKEEVDEYYSKNSNARGSYKTYGATTRSGSAQEHGRQAARNASLGGGAGALGGNRKALGK